MDTNKPLEFHGTAGGYFVLTIVSAISMYIPIFGWAFLLNFASSWFADNSMVNGRKVKYQAGYGESLKFIFIQSLLLFVTLGIYIFWFCPKMYRYVVDHTSYADGTEAAPAPVAAETPAAATPEESAKPAETAESSESAEPSQPSEPTPPAAPTAG